MSTNPAGSNRFAIVASIALVLLLLSSGAWLAWRARSSSDVRSTASGAHTAPAQVIHVGVILSRRTAEADNGGNGPVGYERQARIGRELIAAGIELRPIIDPGTGADQDVAQACHMFFGTAAPIDGGDARALGALDVIVASHVTSLQPQMLDAIEQAVSKSGTGFLMRMFFCQSEPGFTPQVRSLLGFAAEGPTRYNSSHIADCVVTAEHPLLGRLSGTQLHLNMSPNGFAGPYAGTPLICLANSNPPAALVYVADLGRGKIVGCPFAGAKPVPAELEQSGPGTFSGRAVRWLAEQKRASSTGPTTASASMPGQ